MRIGHTNQSQTFTPQVEAAKLQQTVEERDATIAQRDATIVGMQAEIDVVRRPLGMLPSPLLARGPRGLSADEARASLGSALSPANEPTLRAPSELETSVTTTIAHKVDLEAIEFPVEVDESSDGTDVLEEENIPIEIEAPDGAAKSVEEDRAPPGGLEAFSAFSWAHLLSDCKRMWVLLLRLPAMRARTLV